MTASKVRSLFTINFTRCSGIPRLTESVHIWLLLPAQNIIIAIIAIIDVQSTVQRYYEVTRNTSQYKLR